MSANTMNFSEKGAVLVVPPGRSKAILNVFESREYRLFSLDGAELSSKEDLLRKLSEIMQFPDYFGNNWDALEECLNDLEWLPAKGYAIRFKNADIFVKNSRSDFQMFVLIVEAVSASWRVNHVDFILVLESSNLDILNP